MYKHCLPLSVQSKDIVGAEACTSSGSIRRPLKGRLVSSPSKQKEKWLIDPHCISSCSWLLRWSWHARCFIQEGKHTVHTREKSILKKGKRTVLTYLDTNSCLEEGRRQRSHREREVKCTSFSLSDSKAEQGSWWVRGLANTSASPWGQRERDHTLISHCLWHQTPTAFKHH